MSFTPSVVYRRGYPPSSVRPLSFTGTWSVPSSKCPQMSSSSPDFFVLTAVKTTVVAALEVVTSLRSIRKPSPELREAMTGSFAFEETG